MHFLRAGIEGNTESSQLRLPRLRGHQYFDRRPEGATDASSRIILVSNNHISPAEPRFSREVRDSYTVVLRTTELRQRLWAKPSAAPIPIEACGDLADLEFYEEKNAISAMHGNRVLTVELAGQQAGGGYRHILRMANYRFKSATADMGHPLPLGSRVPQAPASATRGPASTSTGEAIVNLTPAQDWGHGASAIQTKVFTSESQGGEDWTSTRIARPGAACELFVPGHMDFVLEVVIDAERAYIRSGRVEHKVEDIGDGIKSMHMESQVSSAYAIVGRD